MQTYKEGPVKKGGVNDPPTGPKPPMPPAGQGDNNAKTYECSSCGWKFKIEPVADVANRHKLKYIEPEIKHCPLCKSKFY
jgi:hypothetical protein